MLITTCLWQSVLREINQDEDGEITIDEYEQAMKDHPELMQKYVCCYQTFYLGTKVLVYMCAEHPCYQTVYPGTKLSCNCLFPFMTIAKIKKIPILQFLDYQ